MIFARPLALIAAAVLAVACSGPSTLPPDRAVEGTFVLREIDGAALPRRLQTSGIQHLTLLADTLIFFRTGRVARVMVTESSVSGSGSPTRSRHEYWMQYSRRGEDITVGVLDCGNTIRCLAPDHGTITPDRIDLATWLFRSQDGEGRTRLVYLRR